MTALNRTLLLVGLCVLPSACATKKQAPAMKRYSLGMARAEYRDYAEARASPCDAEPRWLTDELSAVNGLLARVLKDTADAGNLESLQQRPHLELLQEANQTLEPVLRTHEGNLRAVGGCPFAGTGAFPELTRRGKELLAQVRGRLAEAPGIVAEMQLREAQQRWVEEAPAREAEARRTWCPARPTVGNADLYFARHYPNGRTEWYFCDGHIVESDNGAEPVLQSPENLSRVERRRIQPKRYLDAARAYPSEEIDRQPGTGAAAASPPRTAETAAGGSR